MSDTFLKLKRVFTVSWLALGLSMVVSVHAQEAQIRKNLADSLSAATKIDEISKTPVPGIYEVRVNDSDIFYTDAEGKYIFQGSLLDVKQKRNLTEDRVDKLTAVDFDKLPFKDAFTIVRGNGKRKVAVFEDPNCGYCKHFERGLQQVNDVTVYLFLYPILSPDSSVKSKDIWCSKDRSKTWQDWMVRETPIPTTGNCDTGLLARNVEFGRKHKINGTPTLIFADGTKVPGAIEPPQVEKFLTGVKVQ